MQIYNEIHVESAMKFTMKSVTKDHLPQRITPVFIVVLFTDGKLLPQLDHS